MQTVVGIFRSREAAYRAADALSAAGLPRERIGLALPGTAPREFERRVPTDDGEPSGMGAAVGGVIGGAVGLSAAALVLPGIGPLVVAGVLAAGLAGTAGGAALGDRLEDHLAGGLPRGELPVYEAALTRGLSLAVASVERDDDVARVRDILRASGAEAVDPARAEWMTGLRAPGNQ